MGLLGILVALGLLVWLAYRGWSVLLLAPAAALIAAAVSREPLLAHWTQTFMGSAAQFLAQFFPLFLLGALFGKLMEDSGSVEAIARFMTERLGARRAILAVVLAGALVTYGGVSLVRRLLCFGADGAGAFSGRRHSAAADAGSDRAGDLDVHDDGVSRHSRHSKRDSDAIFRHNAVCRARPRNHRLGNHAGIWIVVARPFRSRRPASR